MLSVSDCASLIAGFGKRLPAGAWAKADEAATKNAKVDKTDFNMHAPSLFRMLHASTRQKSARWFHAEGPPLKASSL
jgi:hypothetical protein